MNEIHHVVFAIFRRYGPVTAGREDQNSYARHMRSVLGNWRITMVQGVIRSFMLLALSPLLLGMGGYPSKYSAEAIEAWAVDADTKKPVEGVIVTANWELEDSTFAGNVPVGQLMVMETVTDKNGRFYFPPWGPKKPPKGGLRNKDPQLLLFKPGYRSRGLVNEFRDVMYEEPIRRSEWNGKTIELKPFKGTMGEWAKHFESLNNDLEHIAADQPEECNWKKMPRTILAMTNERKVLEEKGINPHTLSTLDKRLLMNDEYYTKKGGLACGSPKEFLGSHQP